MDIAILVTLLASIGVLIVFGRTARLLWHQNSRIMTAIAELEALSGVSQGPPGEGVPGRRISIGDRISSSAHAPALGSAAPGFDLADSSGRRVKLADFRGTKLILLFWSPGCRFCKQIIDDIRGWEETDDAKQFDLLIVSTGPEQMHDGMDLRCPVLLDPTSTILQAFGGTGTPSAVVIDAGGNVASALARGGPAVRALLTRARPATLNVIQQSQAENIAAV